MDTVVRRVTTLAGDPAWQVQGYENVKALLSDPRLGRTHPDPENASRMSDSMIFGRAQPTSPTEHEDHVKMRKVLGRSFAARRMAMLRPRVQELVDGLLDQLLERQPPVDFHEAVSFPLPALVICELLGVPYADREDFRRWSEDVGHVNDEQRSMSGLANLWQYMLALLEKKQQEPADDVLSDLLLDYPIDEAAKMAAGVLFAGHETTVTTIDKGILLLVDDAEKRAALAQDPGVLAGTVEEILRSPFPAPATAEEPRGTRGIPRYAKADIEFHGTTIPAGDMVLLDLQDANVDSGQFADPEAFDTSRSPNPHMTFGHGPYFCIGAPLARIELQALFGTLFKRIPTLSLAVPVDQLRVRSHLLTGGLGALPVTW